MYIYTNIKNIIAPIFSIYIYDNEEHSDNPKYSM
jgi:hypothetical protein